MRNLTICIFGDSKVFDASIVILTIDQYRLTGDCISSIRRQNKSDVEIILIDNGSDRRAAQFEVDQYHSFGRNLGYADPCNIGAEYANSDKVVFLNNDTIVSEGWLEPLLQALDNPDVAIAGSKLLYPDGSIQHAGVYFKEIDGKLEGFHKHTEQPAGTVPAVTAACMAVRLNDFKMLGRFDLDYWVGNEDMDLCLKANAAGLKVYYEPASVVTHLESQSGERRWQKVTENVRLLTERWLNRPDVWDF